MVKPIDLVGQTFGRLYVVERAENDKNGRSMFLCECSCGNTVVVLGRRLRTGKTKSCGCYRQDLGKEKVKDLTGKIFGRLTVLGRSGYYKDGEISWKVLCSCGNEFNVRGYCLTGGATQSCGCLQKERASQSNYKDIVGERFGRLVVVERTISKNGHIYVSCQCDCGQVIEVCTSNLRSGKTRSCGCLNNELRGKSSFKDLTGMRFGRLEVIRQCGYKDSRRITWWVCCDCGKEKEVLGELLISGKTRSCGCLQREAASKRLITHGLSKTKEYRQYTDRLKRERKKQYDMWTFEMESALRDSYDCCVLCGITEEEHTEKYNQSLHVDHLYPLSKGFGLKPGNAVLLCQHCNCSKSNKDLDELPEEDQELLINAAEYFKNYWESECKPDYDQLADEYYEDYG